MQTYRKTIEAFSGLKRFSLETERLILESFEFKHMPGIHVLTLEPEIQYYLPDWIATLEMRKEWVEKYEIHENHRWISALPDIDALENDPLRMAIRLKETGAIIGWIVSGYKDELPKPNREIGYAISSSHTSKGYATEAAIALKDFIFNETNVTELVATAMVSNEGSNKVLQKVGYIFENIRVIDGHDYNCYRIKKDA